MPTKLCNLKYLIIFSIAFFAIILYVFKRLKFVSPLNYMQKRNTDSYGSGDFGASRDGGKRSHKGLDFISIPGENVFAPICGVTRNTFPYPGFFLEGVVITGKCTVKLFYIQPALPSGTTVKAGDLIGFAQSLQPKYPGIRDHIHLEVWFGDTPVNPDIFFRKEFV